MDCCSAQADVLIGKAEDNIRTLQNSSGLTIQITRDAKAKMDYFYTSNVDVHDADTHHCIEDDLLNANSATRTDYPFVQSVHAGLSPSLKELKGNSHFSNSLLIADALPNEPQILLDTMERVVKVPNIHWRYLCDVLDTPAIPQAQRPPLNVNVVLPVKESAYLNKRANTLLSHYLTEIADIRS
ncbi:hypothetical protein Tco_1113209 [Tanacetum coccineum]|uniref:Uncharacterized protein n=1 Tax=Tanacetum coccineum TaxID=301880 RepID=A0ABQ5ISS0_9ASTR